MSEIIVWPKSNTKKLRCCFRPPLLKQKVKEEQQPVAVPLLFLHILLSILTLGTVGILGSSEEYSLGTDSAEHISFHEKLIQNFGENLLSTNRSRSSTSESRKINFAEKILERMSNFMLALKQKLGFSRKHKTKKQFSSTKANLEKRMSYCHRKILPNMKNVPFANTDAPFKESGNFCHAKEAAFMHKQAKAAKTEVANKQIKTITEGKEQAQMENSAFGGDNLTELKKDDAIKITLIEKDTFDSKFLVSPKILTMDSYTSTEPIIKVQNRTSVTSIKKVKKMFKKVFPKLSKKRSISTTSTRSKSKLSLVSTRISDITNRKKCASDICVCISPVPSTDNVATSSESNVSKHSADNFNEKLSAHTESTCDSERTPETCSVSSTDETSTATFGCQSTPETENKSETSRSDAFCSGDAPQKEEDKTSYDSFDFSDTSEEEMLKEEFYLSRLQQRSQSEFLNLFQTIWEFPEKFKVDWNQFALTKPFRSFAFHDGKTRKNQKTITPSESAV